MSSIWSAALATAPRFSKYTISPEFLWTSGYAALIPPLDRIVPLLESEPEAAPACIVLLFAKLL